jgi:hypothetical protein
MEMKVVSIDIAEIEKKDMTKNDDPLPQTVPANTITDGSGTSIKVDSPTGGALGPVDYMAIVRKALTASSDTISNSDLYLALFDANGCKVISSLHQNGANDMLHFEFVLTIGANKTIRFRVNGWWKDGFHITNVQEWRSTAPVQPQGSYVTIARSDS